MIDKCIAVLLLIAALAACHPAPSSTELAELAPEAATILQTSPRVGAIPSSKWPPAITRLNPERVYATVDGLYIATSSFFTEEWGLFVPRSIGTIVKPNADPSYVSLGHGFFSYHLKG
jgi:hypothetical protein